MADPLTEYQKVLASRGIGGVFQEEGPSRSGFLRTIDDGSSILNGASPSSVTDFIDAGAHPAQIERMLQSGMGVMPVPKMEGLGKALTYIKENAGVSETPLGNLARKKRMTELMDSGSEAFAESPLDAIAAQIAKAQLGTQSGANDSEIAQRMIADKNKSAAEPVAAEEFRAQEAKSFDDTSMTIADSEKATEDMFKSAMDEFLGMARGASPEKRERTLEEYKKEFAAATGVDVSGKVDKSQALMALGLGLMQNRAGKGFNVGKILNAVGQAGEKALPALEKAKAEAQRAGLAAGQYALQSRNSDQAKDEADLEKGRQRSGFYIVPKGKGVSGFIANIDQGQLERLNPFELDALMSNKSFQEKFDVLPESTFSSVVAEAMKTPEAAVYWDTKAPRKIELFGEGAGDMFTIEAWRALPQSGKDNKLVGSGQDAYEGLARAARDMGKARQKFGDAFGLIEGTSAFRFSLDKVDSLAAAFGVNFKEGTNDTEKLKLFLTKLQAKNAKEILGEAGKTISDADRALVRDIVGDVELFSNPELLEQKVTELFQEIIVKKERDILDALTTLDRYSGRNIASRLGDGGPLTEEEQAEVDAVIAAIGKEDG